MQLVFFRLHLVLHTCAARFDVTDTAQNFLESKQALSSHPNSPKSVQYLSHRILRYVYVALNVDEKKLIAQFGWKL